MVGVAFRAGCVVADIERVSHGIKQLALGIADGEVFEALRSDCRKATCGARTKQLLRPRPFEQGEGKQPAEGNQPRIGRKCGVRADAYQPRVSLP